MVISDDKKVLALCDLSSENAVMEIKTFNVVKEKTEQGYFAAAELTDQLYYEKRGRAEFVLSLTFDTQMDSKTLEPIVTGLSVVIYKVDFVEIPVAEPISDLPFSALRVHRELIKNPSQTIAQLTKAIRCSPHTVAKGICILQDEGYIKRIGTKRTGHWALLKNEKGMPR
jgi:hypothetical protein